MHLRSFHLLLAISAVAACSTKKETVVVAEPSSVQPVEIEVEVYDPVTNYVWENAGVRIEQAYNEWSGCICPSPYPDFAFLTDQFGLVYLGPVDIADYQVGFAEDQFGWAVVGSDPTNDEAVVQVVVFADGFDSVVVDVPLSWSASYAFVSVPFRAPPGYDDGPQPEAATRARRPTLRDPSQFPPMLPPMPTGDPSALGADG